MLFFVGFSVHIQCRFACKLQSNFIASSQARPGKKIEIIFFYD